MKTYHKGVTYTVSHTGQICDDSGKTYLISELPLAVAKSITERCAIGDEGLVWTLSSGQVLILFVGILVLFVTMCQLLS